MTIETPSKKKLILIDNLTVRQRNAVRSVLISKKLMTTGGELNPDMHGDELDVLEKLLIETCVTSYDDITENIYESMQDSEDISDYDFIIQKCMEKLNQNLAKLEGTGGDNSSPKTQESSQS